ncbi:type II secretion system protein GspM [Pseudomonas sp. PSKL.D1]|uniref:type II secretion system protein GspM n=1 Tax=Pseudomonas sp. PSKL.D1 TaxID=3029060 RepID=UPI0023813446|nr:type II secretion system protein GspM [Pseudomonas sp. PSKL.D1]WDY57009.1 type II secretion system protein GspM [Pseudomonas sp. PSKL.D1]
MSRGWIQHHRLWLAWGLIGVLLVFLSVREGLAQWRDLSLWRGLAEQAVMLQGLGPALSLERLNQSAQARRVDLAEVDTQGKQWQLRGQVPDDQALQGWLQALRAEGAQPLQWGLERGEKGLHFSVVLQP